jgi:hypothetical protein
LVLAVLRFATQSGIKAGEPSPYACEITIQVIDFYYFYLDFQRVREVGTGPANVR